MPRRVLGCFSLIILNMAIPKFSLFRTCMAVDWHSMPISNYRLWVPALRLVSGGSGQLPHCLTTCRWLAASNVMWQWRGTCMELAIIGSVCAVQMYCWITICKLHSTFYELKIRNRRLRSVSDTPDLSCQTLVTQPWPPALLFLPRASACAATSHSYQTCETYSVCMGQPPLGWLADPRWSYI